MAADGQDFPSQSPKAPLHAVADYRPADLFADGEADALGGIAVAATADEQDEARRRRAPSGVRGEEVRALAENV